MELYKWGKNGNHQLIGSFQGSLLDLQGKPTYHIKNGSGYYI